MRTELLELICCPDCKAELSLENEVMRDGEVFSGQLACGSGQHRFQIRDWIPRFVEEDAYADAFSMEWNSFKKAHLKKFTGLDYLDESFREFIDFPIDRLKGKLVLDAGAGLGRFSEVVTDHGGTCVAVDLSYAIDAARENLHERENIFFIQADIFRLPFKDETFDFVYSWGVLHHTPDPPKAFQQLPRLVKQGGKLMIFVYAKYNKAYLKTTFAYRKITTRLPQKLLLKLCYIAIPLYYVGKIPAIGPFITRILLPVSVRPPTHMWRVCNTFDLYSPEYVFVYDHVEVYHWFGGHGFDKIEPVGPDSGVCFIATKGQEDPAWGREETREAIRAGG
jgi:ubiquinone/menaquinone biosynthesis C-methylase UbiE/uncharacterized protein YbaR (Trm112 family)